VLSALAVAEESEFASDDIVWVGHSYFKTNLRNDVQDGSQGVPLWDAAGSTIAGYPVYWTRGARLSAVATSKPVTGNSTIGTAGNPILIAVPRALLIPGRHVGPANRNGSGEAFEWMVTDPKTGPGAASDTMYLKVRGRLAFQHGDSAGIVEATE